MNIVISVFIYVTALGNWKIFSLFDVCSSGETIPDTKIHLRISSKLNCSTSVQYVTVVFPFSRSFRIILINYFNEFYSLRLFFYPVIPNVKCRTFRKLYYEYHTDFKVNYASICLLVTFLHFYLGNVLSALYWKWWDRRVVRVSKRSKRNYNTLDIETHRYRNNIETTSECLGWINVHLRIDSG